MCNRIFLVWRSMRVTSTGMPSARPNRLPSMLTRLLTPKLKLHPPNPILRRLHRLRKLLNLHSRLLLRLRQMHCHPQLPIGLRQRHLHLLPVKLPPTTPQLHPFITELPDLQPQRQLPDLHPQLHSLQRAMRCSQHQLHPNHKHSAVLHEIRPKRVLYLVCGKVSTDFFESVCAGGGQLCAVYGGSEDL